MTQMHEDIRRLHVLLAYAEDIASDTHLARKRLQQWVVEQYQLDPAHKIDEVKWVHVALKEGQTSLDIFSVSVEITYLWSTGMTDKIVVKYKPETGLTLVSRETPNRPHVKVY